MKKIITVLLVIVIAGGVLYWFKKPPTTVINNSPTKAQTKDYKNISYAIEGEQILLKNGIHEAPAAPGSEEIVVTEYMGNEVKGDFNNDGTQDVAFILTQSGGGTGVFYYVVVALQGTAGYKGTNAISLGDRIAPQTTEFRNGKIIVNYADRKPDEPYSAEPSVGVSKYFKVSGSKLIEVSP